MKYLTTKVALPRLAGTTLPRRRLVDRIARAGQASLIVLQAPAGYGKSTLAAQLLLRQPRERAAWLHLEETDCTITRFVAYVLFALAQPVALVREARLHDAVTDRQLTADEALEHLCALLAESGQGRTWLVLDNWESVNGEREICSFVERLAFHAAEFLRIVIATRARPSIRLRKQEADGAVLRIGQADLQFSFEEFRTALTRAGAGQIENSQLEQLFLSSRGWPIQIGLISGSSAGAELSIGPDDVFEMGGEYVREEILERLPEDLRRLLELTSLLDTVTAAAAAVICRIDVNDAHRLLQQLEYQALPFDRVGEGDDIRLHPLVRESVRALTRTRLRGTELHDWFDATARWYASAGDHARACELWFALPDFPAGLAYVAANWFELLQHLGWPRIQHLLDQVPQEFHQLSSYRRVRTNLLGHAGNSRELITYLGALVDPDSPLESEELGHLWVQYQWAQIQISEQHAYNTIRKEWDRLNARRGPFSDKVRIGAEVVLHIAALNDFDAALSLEHLDTATALVGDSSIDYKVNLLNNRALIRHLLGEYEPVLAAYDQNIALCEHHRAFAALPLALVNKADVLRTNGRFREALAVLGRCRDVIHDQAMHNPLAETFLYRHSGLCHIALGDLTRGLHELQLAADHGSRASREEMLTAHALHTYYSRIGSLPSPFVDAEQSPAGALRESRFYRLFDRGERLSRAFGLAPDAPELQELKALAERGGFEHWLVAYRILHGLVYYQHDAKMEGDQLMRLAMLSLAARQASSFLMASDFLIGFVIIWTTLQGTSLDTAARILAGEQVIETAAALAPHLRFLDDQVDAKVRLLSLVRQVRLRDAGILLQAWTGDHRPRVTAAIKEYETARTEFPLRPLQIRLLGEFSIRRDRTTVSIARSKGERLFLYLLLAGPSGVHEEVLCDYFWPASPLPKAKASLQTTVRDIRQSLDPSFRRGDQAYVRYEAKAYALNLPAGSRIDLREFEEALDVANEDLRSRNQSTQPAFQQLRAALRLYAGDLAPHLPYEEFLLHPRERARQRFLAGVLASARLAADTDELKPARALLESALERDLLWRDGVRALMELHVRLDSPYRALLLYRQYERTLHQELGVGPDEELRDFLATIIAAPKR